MLTPLWTLNILETEKAIKKTKLHIQKQIQPLLTPLGLPILKINHTLLIEQSNEHSYQVWFNWPSGFREEDKKQTTPFLTHLGLLFLVCTSVQQSTKKIQMVIQWISLPSFVLISQVVSEKKIKNRPHPFYTFGFLLCTSDQQQNIKTFKGPSNDHSYQVWATGFREED